MKSPEKINLDEKLAAFTERWTPKIIAELNGQHVKLAKIEGEFVWHAHDHEDELFMVIDGELEMQFRDRTVTVAAGEFIVVPRGVEHCPKAARETSILLFEPTGTLNTGDAGGDRTVSSPERL